MVYLELAMWLFAATAIMIVLAFYTALHKQGWPAIIDVFMPEMRGLTPSYEVAAIIVHPLFWITCIGIVAFFTISLMFSIDLTIVGYEWLAFSFSLVIFFALFDPIVIWFSEGKYREPLRFVFGALSCGMLSALVAFFFNSIATLFLNEQFGPKMGVLMLIAIAPVIEEVLKMLGVILISGHKMFKGPLDGILVGFSVGTGFAMVENIFYISTKIPENSVELLVFRALYNTLAHGAFTAIGGAVLGKIKQDFKMPNLLLLTVPVLVAALTHTAFNVLAIVDIVGVNSLVLNYYIFSPVMVVALLIIVAILIFYNWSDKKKKMSMELAELGVDADFDKEFEKLKRKVNK